MRKRAPRHPASDRSERERETRRDGEYGVSVTVEELLSLQELDLEIFELADRLQNMTAELEAQRAELEGLDQQVAETRGRMEEADERLRKFQRAVQAGRATLKRLEGRAQAVTNMDQHLAVRMETETARRNLRIAEEDAMDALQDVENTRLELEELGSRLTEGQVTFEARRHQVEIGTTEMEGRIEVARDQKKNKELHIDRRVLKLYEKVRAGRTDSVLVALTPDGVCGHCFTSVPLQRQADIRAGRELAVCEGCGIILYSTRTAD